jgi:Cof subfamily protein (haloacid dehalogenase superfamily)
MWMDNLKSNGHNGYKMIVTDLDGTLRPMFKPLSHRVIGAVQQAQARGVRVVLATGRMYLSAEPAAVELGLDMPMICSQGASIHNAETGETLFEKNVPLGLARDALLVTDPEITVVVCRAQEFFVQRMTQHAIEFVGNNREFLHVIPDLPQSLDREPQKILFTGDVAAIDRLMPRLQEKFGDTLQVVKSFDTYIEMTHRDVSKGKAAEWLADKWGIPREQVIAMGDHDNDRSMIEWAGLGVAMGNAIPSVKAIADFIAPTDDDDGAALVIEKFILGENE